MSNKFRDIVDWYFSRQAAPYWAVLAVDTFIVVITGLISCYFVYESDVFTNSFVNMFNTLILVIPGYLIGFRIFNTYSGIVRYSTSFDLIKISGGLATGSCIALGIHYIIREFGFDFYYIRGLVILLQFFIATAACIFVRIAVKVLYDTMLNSATRQKVFVYGVHEGGEALGRSIISDKESPYVLSGFVADEPDLMHHRMMGVRVYLNDEHLVDTMLSNKVKILFVSPLRNDALRDNTEFLNNLVKKGIKIMIQPNEMEWDGTSDLTANQLHEVDIEDLLPRDKIEVDLKAIGQLLNDKVVMITGAAGSIGYEMARQVAKFSPKHLVLVDQAETPMHTVRLHMANHYKYIPCETIVSSISNKSKMESIFAEFRPDYIFHAAAYKHVPMMENNPSEAIQNNVYGTRVIADLAVKYGVKKFVMISTDKAVNPTNVMGCSKRICEIYCQALNMALANFRETNTADESIKPHLIQIDGKPGITQFVTTRFGNVLGSNGSVIPLFRKQIQNGGPVTVTHPDIIRFFMLIPEACRLVLEAGTMGNGGEIFVFDMGKPVRIADLAQRMIDLSGAKNVKIEYTGLRDGEKLFEEVLNDEELTKPTVHPKIKVSSVREYPFDLALKNEEELYDLSFTYDDMKIVAKMKEIVPEYKSKHSKYEVLDK